MADVRTIKGRAWRKDSPIKGSLNEILKDTEISFIENQNDGTEDIAVLKFVLKGEEYGEYAEEYIPDTVSKQGHKLIDITAMLIDETNKKGNWYILDVKSTVGGEDVIFKLVEQLKQGYQYLRNSVLNYLQDINFDECLGVVTRKFDEHRIENLIQAKNSEIINPSENVSLSIAAVKKRKDNLKLLKEIECLSDFYNKRILYKDNYENKYLKICVILEGTTDNKIYSAEINIGKEVL